MGEKRNAGREPRSDAVHVVYGIGGYNSEGMKSDNPYAGIHLVETARTLDLNGGNPACNQGECLYLKKYDDSIIVLNGKGGQRQRCYLLYQRTVGSLCQDDYKGPNRQYADQDKLIIEVCEVITR